jgi:hypothetical protein
MALWVYDKKFLMGMRFLFLTLAYTAGEDDDLEHPAQEQEEWRRRQSSSSSLQALRTRDHVTMILSTQLKNKKSGDGDNRLRVPSRP